MIYLCFDFPYVVSLHLEPKKAFVMLQLPFVFFLALVRLIWRLILLVNFDPNKHA